MKRRPESDDAIPPRLQQVLESLMDQGLARRLRTVYAAAAAAIEQLSALNLVRYERKTSIEDGPADLSLWEEMAPAVGDTMVAVNTLLGVIRKEFPPSRDGGDVDRDAPSTMDERLALEVDSVLQRTAEILGKEVARVRERVLRPEVVSDRWALLTELQNVRGGMRRQAADMVYLTAAAFGEVDRAKVVPGHMAEVAAAAELRSTAAELRRALRVRLEKLTDGVEPSQVANQVEGDLDMFVRMPAFLTLRAPEKRQVAQLRAQLRRAAIDPGLSSTDVASHVETLRTLLRSIGETASREVLTAHDREVWVACGLLLEQAALHVGLGSLGAQRALAQAAKSASALNGIEPGFDIFMRRLRNARLAALSAEEVEKELISFREQLAKLPFH